MFGENKEAAAVADLLTLWKEGESWEKKKKVKVSQVVEETNG